MGSTGQDAAMSGGELRERLTRQPEAPQRVSNADEAAEVVMALNAEESRKQIEAGKEHPRAARTYGRTPDGTVFTVPETHDMVSQLFSPSEPKNISDFILIAFLAFHVSMLLWVPRPVQVPVFAIVYLFWRISYNAGIGWLLQAQSNGKWIVNWARKSRLFEKPAEGRNRHPGLYKFMKREFEAKIPKDYKFEEAPLEYNTWLLFRRFVDIILMCDFVSYCVFAIACGGRPENESVLLTAARWAGGIILFLFNLWVKLDAHRVVKDFAWYWGDFFFLVDQELLFDGVFEMAPHPMYSVGYAGYYGISLMAGSYKVLFISILGHAAQMVFLSLVENPHIEKTYSAPPPLRRRSTPEELRMEQKSSPDKDPQLDPTSIDAQVPYAAPGRPRGLLPVDPHSFENVATVLILVYLAAFTLLTPSTPLYQAIFIANAAIWRIWFSVGIGYILDCQSYEKTWTRHFIKYGETTGTAWRQWKRLYLFSLAMTHGSFIAAALKMYALPANWSYGLAILRHVVGLALITLQTWTADSIYQSLGEFGWFFGDFFFEAPDHNLTYSGIYRFLNNPERVLGLAGLWGVALITWSTPIFFLALMSHVLSLAFIQFVEKPHMQRRYGESLRRQSGLSKSIRRAIPGRFRRLQGSVDKVFDETVELLEDVVEGARPLLAKGVGTFVSDTRRLFSQYPARISITRVHPDLAGLDPADYTLEVEGGRFKATTPPRDGRRDSNREPDDDEARADRDALSVPIFDYGAPIKVHWTAPVDHSPGDWIGLYAVGDNDSREVTRVSSHGRWIATNAGEWESDTAHEGILASDQPLKGTAADGRARVTGEVEFAGDKLFWTEGAFEVRYHHAGKHTVMAVSRAFEVRVPHFDDSEASSAPLDPLKAAARAVAAETGLCQRAVAQALLPVVQNCFDRDPDVAPRTADEDYGDLVWREGKWARRVVYAVHQMFGIELSPQVVRADGTVQKLALRICSAKRVLAPYSMTPSQARSAPGSPK